ncbi:MAG: MmcQ/YjbR family DNA-binding protein [Acidobacteria bacterium]|nr:MmcQ/YjbR family DNA-binding protein [Acidobacteriota bacterium]
MACDFQTVRKLGLQLEGVVESTTYGAPALKFGRKLLACMTTHRSAEPGTLAVRVGFVERDELIAEAPAIYYVKPHYLNYPVVLVRLARVSEEALGDLLRMGWRFVKRH